jgi:hypothetical protein
MNARVSLPSLPATPVPSRGPCLAQASIVPVGDHVAALIFDRAAPAARGARLNGLVEGLPIGGPLVSTSLALRDGGRRHLLLLGRSADSLVGRAITLSLGSDLAAAVDPDWLQPPLADGAALIDGLSEDGHRRLLKLFLTTGASLFGFGEASEFGRAARRLLDLLGVRPVDCAAVCPAGSAGTILSYRLPVAVAEAEAAPFVALGPTQAVRLPACRVACEPVRGGHLLHLHVPQRLPAGAPLISLGARPLHLCAPDRALAPQPLQGWIAGRDAETRAWVLRILEEVADDPIAAATLAELVHCDREPPTLEVGHLSGTARGLLHALSLSDPHDLVRAVRLERGPASHDIPVGGDAPGIGATRRLEGYVALPRADRAGERCRVRLVFRSGRVQTVAEQALDGYRGGVPAGFACSPAAAGALARARLDVDRDGRAARHAEFGPPRKAPALSVVADLSPNLDLLRARAALLFAEPGGHRVELIHLAADGPLAEAARAVLIETSAVYGISQRLVTLRRGADAADRLLAGIEAARAERLLLLGPEVLPAAAGWLAPWLRQPDAAQPLLGATLLDPAGAVLDAGGRDDLRGLSASDLPGIALTSAERPTAACVGLTREAAKGLFEATPYPNPDLMLAALAGRLAREGREPATLLRSRFVRYAEPADQPLDRAADAEALRLTLGDLTE